MKVSGRSYGEVDILDVRGRSITIGEDALVRDTLERLLDDGRTRILVNLARVRYMDPAGVGELIHSQVRAAAFGGTVKLLNPADRVFDLLLLTKLSDVFEIYKDELEAVASFVRSAA